MSRGKSRAGRGLDLILCDLDGTLIDSKGDIAASANHTLRVLGFEDLPAEQIYGFIGDGVRKLLERVLPPDRQGEMEKAWEIFSRHYLAHLLETTVLYPGVPEFLAHFRHKTKIVVTNKPELFALPVLRGLGVLSCFERIVGGESMPLKKPHPDAILALLREKEVGGGRALMIGDGVNDLEAGRRAGVLTCAVTYGLSDRETLAACAPNLLVDDLRELFPLFR